MRHLEVLPDQEVDRATGSLERASGGRASSSPAGRSRSHGLRPSTCPRRDRSAPGSAAPARAARSEARRSGAGWHWRIEQRLDVADRQQRMLVHRIPVVEVADHPALNPLELGEDAAEQPAVAHLGEPIVEPALGRRKSINTWRSNSVSTKSGPGSRWTTRSSSESASSDTAHPSSTARAKRRSQASGSRMVWSDRRSGRRRPRFPCCRRAAGLTGILALSPLAARDRARGSPRARGGSSRPSGAPPGGARGRPNSPEPRRRSPAADGSARSGCGPSRDADRRVRSRNSSASLSRTTSSALVGLAGMSARCGSGGPHSRRGYRRASPSRRARAGRRCC